jgi:hypothetical protein
LKPPKRSGAIWLAGWLIALTAAVSLLVPASGVAQAPLFYTGAIVIDSVSAVVDVTDRVEVTVDYRLVNDGTAAESVALSFVPADASAKIDGHELNNPVSFEPGSERNLSISYSMAMAPTGSPSIQFSSILLLNDMATAERVRSYEVRLVLPEGGDKLIYSSMAYDDATYQDGRAVFLWSKSDLYLSPLSISWTSLDVDIAASKTASPATITSAGETVEVEVTVRNQGDGEVGNITLVDSFHPGAFEPVAPLDEFELVQPESSDPHLYWRKQIASLAAGETRSYDYTVKVKTLALETRLEPLVVTADGTPVAVSNDVVLFDGFEDRYQPQSAAGGFPAIPVAVGVVAFALCTTLAYAVTIRKRTS